MNTLRAKMATKISPPKWRPRNGRNVLRGTGEARNFRTWGPETRDAKRSANASREMGSSRTRRVATMAGAVRAGTRMWTAVAVAARGGVRHPSIPSREQNGVLGSRNGLSN